MKTPHNHFKIRAQHSWTWHKFNLFVFLKNPKKCKFERNSLAHPKKNLDTKNPHKNFKTQPQHSSSKIKTLESKKTSQKFKHSTTTFINFGTIEYDFYLSVNMKNTNTLLFTDVRSAYTHIGTDVGSPAYPSMKPRFSPGLGWNWLWVWGWVWM